MIGKILQSSIHAWLRYTGRKISFTQYPWLMGPSTEGKTVGEHFYKKFASENKLEIELNEKSGLLPDFSQVLNSATDKANVNPKIAHFYEQTARFKLEVWSEWYAPVSIFARILITSVSRQIEQFNIPLSPLETSRGMSSEVIHFKQNGQVHYACWLRKSIKTGKVVYAGFYTSCYIPELDERFVKVVFPLPQGNVIVILRVEVQPDGSVKLISAGKKFGEAGYYRIHKLPGQEARVKYVPLKEVIHVFEDEAGTLRTDHVFRFLGMKFLHLHYKIFS